MQCAGSWLLFIRHYLVLDSDLRVRGRKARQNPSKVVRDEEEVGHQILWVWGQQAFLQLLESIKCLLKTTCSYHINKIPAFK